MKRTAALSIQTIIIAAVGILVLSVLAYLLIGTGQDTSDTVSCTTQGGTCTNDCGPGGEIDSAPNDACPPEQTCCQPLKVQQGR